MYNISGKLKQLTLGATLSLALAFLIIHLGMIVTTEAQSFEGIYLPEPVDSIVPDLEGEDWGLNPFYPSRPIEYDLAYLNVGIDWYFVLRSIWALAGIASTAVLIVLAVIIVVELVVKGINRIRRAACREKANYFMLRHGDQIGKTECKRKEGKGKSYLQCIASEMDAFLIEFRDQCQTCKSGKHENRKTKKEVRGQHKFYFNYDYRDTTYSCIQMVNTTGRGNEGKFKQFHLFDWDPKIWF